MERLLQEIKACTICAHELPLGANPVVRASKMAKIVIVGQAPGTRVHATGIPWNDPSGNELRRWLNIDSDVFYDASKIAIIPMGFGYPGKGKSGDLPPRKECAPAWHPKLFSYLNHVELVLLIGQYAQNYYLCTNETLTATVQNYQQFLPKYFPLPHPSPRNRFWMKKNSWFEQEVVPALRLRIKEMV